MRRLPLLFTTLAVAGLAACGSEESPSTPGACLGGSDTYVAALAAAPEEVTLDGTPLGDCLPDEQPSGQLATVGEGMVGAAKELNAKARKQPLGEVPVQLGYLVGTVMQRAKETGGIHSDLALNVERAALYIPNRKVLPAGFQQRYEEGIAAAGE